MIDPYRLNRHVLDLVRPELEGLRQMLGQGTVVSTESNEARLDDGASYKVAPHLAVIVGDLVSTIRSGGYRLITDVLNRNALVQPAAAASGTQVSQPDSPAATVAYLARIKETADATYRLELGLDASDRPQLLLGSGTAVDVRAYRSAAKTLLVDDGAAGNLTLVNIIATALQRAGNAVLDAGSHGVTGDPHTQYLRESFVQSFRGTSIAAIAATTGQTEVITWPTAWGDTNYTALAMVESTNGNAAKIGTSITALSSTTISIRLYNSHTSSITPDAIHVIGIHD